MLTFNAYFKKEIIESIRQYKYLILAIGIILFAMLDPIMLKVLPLMLKNKIPGDISALIKIDFSTAIQNYIKDLSQVSFLIVILTLMGILSDEISSHKLLFPYTKGLNPAAMVASKILHYSIVLIIFIFLGFSINYYYADTLFKDNTIPFSKIMFSATLISLFYIYTVILLTFLSSLFKKSIVAAVALLIINFAASALMSIEKLSVYIPNKLIALASTFNTSDIIKPLISTLMLSIVFYIISIIRMNKIEI
ncbi:ABC transporter permease [Thermoanaerobacterium butyriciformans]|uniref:ABC-2 type transport system permease protein n=1 Tax=Thermoanaerobacterium butyriciformans TaxID=1702242 RepID=A0ABS4NHZ9_9THEO|nr:ABC transporter permease [Thermoanaerobacterium butyriciformans]MBP2073302.1 ABC-2 type transport system permease protein [Thermoanaerobacterium butyriciformans]HHV75068.1 ABC transporter permease [Thermoanaerobacterium sp.]